MKDMRHQCPPCKIHIKEGLFIKHMESKEHHKHIERYIHDLNEQGSMDLID
jgi:hypothetical protein